MKHIYKLAVLTLATIAIGCDNSSKELKEMNSSAKMHFATYSRLQEAYFAEFEKIGSLNEIGFEESDMSHANLIVIKRGSDMIYQLTKDIGDCKKRTELVGVINAQNIYDSTHELVIPNECRGN